MVRTRVLPQKIECACLDRIAVAMHQLPVSAARIRRCKATNVVDVWARCKYFQLILKIVIRDWLVWPWGCQYRVHEYGVGPRRDCIEPGKRIITKGRMVRSRLTNVQPLRILVDIKGRLLFVHCPVVRPVGRVCQHLLLRLDCVIQSVPSNQTGFCLDD